MPHEGFFEALQDIPEKPRSIVHTTQLIPDWVPGATYTGKFTFILKSMHTEGMVLEVISEDFSESEVVDPGPNSEQNSGNTKVTDFTSPGMGANRPNNFLDPRSIVPRP